jgi:hypothetical protein
MKKSIVLPVVFFVFCFLNSCEKGRNNGVFNMDCNKLKAGLILYQDSIVNVEISKLNKDLNPKITNADVYGHGNNFEILISRVNTCEDIFAESFCYACIKTNPPQSEILVNTDSSGVSVSRIIDIVTPSDGKLSFRTIHQAYSNPGVKLRGTSYFGCFEGSTKAAPVNTDTIYYGIANDTLRFRIIKNYNCCGLLKDSLVIDNDIVRVYISDTCKTECICRCDCDFGFEYAFTDFWRRNTDFKVYLKGLNEREYTFWKETSFIDGLDK